MAPQFGKSLRIVALLSLMTTTGIPATKRILVHGHRGARAVRPENTLPAFEYAIRTGVDALELDLAVTKDNVKSTVVKDGFITASELCSGSYAKACEEAGISG